MGINDNYNVKYTTNDWTQNERVSFLVERCQRI